MKRLLLFPVLLFATASFGQIVDQFNYTGALNANDWITHSGTAGQFLSDNSGSLTYPGLPTSVGNKASFVSGNTEDINKAISGISGKGYLSLLINVPNTTGLSATGDHFIGFSKQAGTTGVSNFAGRLSIRIGSTAGTFNLGIVNYSGGTPVASYSTVDYPVGTTVFVVISVNTTVTPYSANLFVNPTPGSAEPTPTVSNNTGTGNDFTTFASVYLRQGNNTGNTQIDEIRVGSTWASVTPAGGPAPCVNTTATIDTVSCAASYTTPSGLYTHIIAGTYNDTIPNADGCDSLLTINLSFVTSINYYPDLDGDGLGDHSATAVPACIPPTDHVANNNDCDDTDALIGAGITYYEDNDGDTFGDLNTATVLCAPTAGYVTNSLDCDDSDDQIGIAQTYYQDLDGDGFGNPSVSVTTCTPGTDYVLDNTDCNDNNNAIHPGATEIPDNGIDEDCNGSDLSTLGSQLATYEFNSNDCPLVASALEATSTATDLTFEPYAIGGTLTCNSAVGVFNHSEFNGTATVDLTQYYSFGITPDDCIGMDLNRIIFTHKISNSGGTPTIHLRSSLDNYASDIATKQLLNSTAKTDTINLGTAFDNVTTAIEFRWYVTNMAATGATYRHDNVKVFGSTFALTPQTFYADTDGDGFGDATNTVSACTAPANYVVDNTDCDDTDATEFPGAIWYPDTDGDGFGDASATGTVSCTQPTDFVSNNDDCNDADDQITVEILYYVDLDEDGYGDSNDQGTLSCTVIAGSVTNNDDCDDDDDTVYPNAPEICDGVDNNCDGTVDEGLATTTYYKDADGDTYGDSTQVIVDCVQPAGYVTNNTDCDDANAAAYPGATDITGNGIDENCDGVDGYLGIDELAFASLSVYPNPGNSIIVLSASENMSNAQVTFVGIDGKELILAGVQTASSEITFNTTNLVSGTYFIRVVSEKGTSLVRWVKN